MEVPPSRDSHHRIDDRSARRTHCRRIANAATDESVTHRGLGRYRAVKGVGLLRTHQNPRLFFAVITSQGDFRSQPDRLRSIFALNDLSSFQRLLELINAGLEARPFVFELFVLAVVGDVA